MDAAKFLTLAPAAKFGTIGLAAAAGLTAYFLTRYLITRKPKRREEKLAAAAEAATAYREARAAAAVMKGKALTPAENVILGKEFKRKLKALGVDNFSQKG